MKKSILKLVHSNEHKQRKERLIVGEIHRKDAQLSDKNKRLTRKYSCSQNAIAYMTKWMFINGKVGDVCVIYHEITGLEIGTIKMTLKGKIETKFIFDDK